MLLNQEIATLTQIIDEMRTEKGENWAVKQIVIFQNNLKDRLDRLIKEERKDNLLTFEQLGVDYLFVDEAHMYKELCYEESFGNGTLLHSATALFAVHSEDCVNHHGRVGVTDQSKHGKYKVVDGNIPS